MRYWLILFLAFLSPSHAAPLSHAVLNALNAAHIPEQNTGIIIWDSMSPAPSIMINPNRAFNPASTMKLLTSYAALNLLGPAYTWKTDIYYDGNLHDGTLNGNLYLKGFGDPDLTVERYWMLLHQLRLSGIQHINGDLVIDQRYFQLSPRPQFDDHPNRAYNAEPAALMVNFNSSEIKLTPNTTNVTVQAEPLPSDTHIFNHITLNNETCGEWRDAIHTEWQADTHQLSLNGNYARDCGEKSFALNLGNASTLAAGLFQQLWQAEGGTITGTWRVANTPDSAQLVFSYSSPPLAQIIYDINKYSNNIMARSVFLSLSSPPSANIASASDNVKNWLKLSQLDFPELILENGAGLSRLERISPYHMAQLLYAAYHSPYYPELANSLPIVAMDGTMKKRLKDTLVAGRAHIKTGTLDGVKTMAGYVHATNGHTYIVVFFINDEHAQAGGLAQDTLLQEVDN
ncbi:D-alanyl-D-alanine carboxypeptidase/D-alanyl-D-alanine endopeptidase [Sulfuriferula nivalis]|uniref:D-alanyl-D-alanine carboxypeptidase n=1 Tax=Sulfuriferula nivalis TaxID=2675298 RepID=A0A809RN52_9PROT|nr:D-alanyl-D-alanine carboxypeptidase/D-alanyl-D-alanine-endopeptidase [Sulfuriferula nivalis]BBP02204.1 D-alanyl-D-alanine carboxypeptidase [Sulfuriferula nivalis]